MCGVREHVLAAANNPQGSGWLKIVLTIHSRHAPWEGRATEHTNEDTNGPDLLPKNAPVRSCRGTQRCVEREAQGYCCVVWQ
jgi:hypothetical protein